MASSLYDTSEGIPEYFKDRKGITKIFKNNYQ